MKLIGNKSGWKRVRLDDVVVRREENDKANARSRFDTFVKVEHMEAGSLHLQGLGSQKDEELPPTFYKIFRKGQILFPTRNPHLRRTALAPCDGICGEKTLTLEVNEEVADQRLIPFLFHSASFYDHSAGAIIGSTNPHCRWRDIANYEFLLPPKDQQTKLAELLWATDAVAESHARLRKKTEVTTITSVLNEAYATNSRIKRSSVPSTLADFISVKHGFPFKSDFWADDDGMLPIALTIGNFDYAGAFRFESSQVKCYSGDYPSEYALDPGSLVVAMTCLAGGQILGTPAFVLDDERTYLHNQRIGLVAINDGKPILLSYLHGIFLSPHFRSYIRKSASGTMVKHTSPNNILSYPVVIPEITEQQAVVDHIGEVFSAIASAKSSLLEIRRVQNCIINQIF